MENTQRNLLHDERGVEPTVMKILVGIILVSIGLGIGVTMYQRIGSNINRQLNYSVTVSPSSDTIKKGNTKTADVTVSTNVGFDEQVTLTPTGVPTGVTISFHPSAGTPTFGSSMQITVNENAPTIVQTITINGETDTGGKKTATFELTITE